MDNIIDTDNIEKAKNLIRKSSKPIIIKAKNPEFNRKIIEYGKFDILLDIELLNYKNSLRQIDSGLNEYLLKTMTKNRIALGIDLLEIKRLQKKEKAILLSRISQNIFLARKTNTKIIILNYKDKADTFNLLISIGASTKQANEAISF